MRFGETSEDGAGFILRRMFPKKKERRTIPPLSGDAADRERFLPSVPKAHGRFGAMRGAIRTGKAGQIISRRIVYQAAVLGSQEDVVCYIEVSSATIDESGPSL